MKDLKGTYAIIGAGPSGLAMARNFQKENIDFVGFERHSSVGGLWDINNPNSTVYKSAHLISSKRMTEFSEYPMKDSVADFPSHRDLCEYFNNYADHFKIREKFLFNTGVRSADKQEGGRWLIIDENGESYLFDGVVIANGNLSEPNIPTFPGNFDGEIVHSKEYKDPEIFKNKRVLVIGAGNSGCDIVVDAVHHANSVDISTRRGYHFIPKYILGKPADTVGGKIKLPMSLKRIVDSKVLKLFTGDPTRFGFPEPDHKLYESHPVINSLILHYIGHGDVHVQKGIERLEGNTVHFKDGSKKDYDMILLATGYKLHYPFLDAKKYLNLKGVTPQLFLNIFPPKEDSLYMIGLVEALGLGWQGRFEQGTIIAKSITAKNEKPENYKKFNSDKRANNLDLTGGSNYLKLDRMAYYVDKSTYLKKMAEYNQILDQI